MTRALCFRSRLGPRLHALLCAENEFWLHLLKDGFNCRDLPHMVCDPYSSVVNGWKTAATRCPFQPTPLHERQQIFRKSKGFQAAQWHVNSSISCRV
jgi:hypothetical protein